jgi:hypothetical protein
MPLPSKNKGFRSIVVADIKFRWKFYPGSQGSSIKIYGKIPSKSELQISLPDWIDPWHSLSGFFINPEKKMNFIGKINEPELITPDFIEKAILFGLQSGWGPDLGKMTIEYKNNKFS